MLVNNAGVYGPMGEIGDVDWRAWVETIEVNLLGSVLMARAVVPSMKARCRRSHYPDLRRRRHGADAAHHGLRGLKSGSGSFCRVARPWNSRPSASPSTPSRREH